MASHGDTGTDQLVLRTGEGGCELVLRKAVVRLQDCSPHSVIMKKPGNMKNIGPFDEYSIDKESVSEKSAEPKLYMRHLPDSKGDCLPCTTATINSLESENILTSNHCEEAFSSHFSKSTSHSPSPSPARSKSRLISRLSLKRKGKKTFSTPSPANSAHQLLQQASANLSVQKLYQASADTSGVKLGDRLVKFQERRTKSARIISVRKRPEFLSGDDVCSSDEEVESVKLIRRLDDEDWQPVEKMKMSKKRRKNVRKQLGKRKLFNIGRDYMDDSAESDDEENHKNERTKNMTFSGSRKGILSTVEKLKREGSLADQFGAEVNSNTPVQKWR